MLFDIILVLLVIISFFLGRKKGFMLEFFSIFKFLLIIFIINFSYPIVGKILKISIKNSRDNLKIYIITFLILYLTFTFVVKISEKFLKSIKLDKCDKILGGILGVIKSSFIIFIIYIIVLVGTPYSKKIKDKRDNSIIIKEITEYGYIYTEIFPDFIKKDIDIFREKLRKEKIKKELLKEFKEKNKETIKQKSKDFYKQAKEWKKQNDRSKQ